jgi:hypothetical protein
MREQGKRGEQKHLGRPHTRSSLWSGCFQDPNLIQRAHAHDKLTNEIWLATEMCTPFAAARAAEGGVWEERKRQRTGPCSSVFFVFCSFLFFSK